MTDVPVVETVPNSAGRGHGVYVQKLGAAGVPQWTANGAVACTTAGVHLNPAIVPDGAGGAFLWTGNGVTSVLTSLVDAQAQPGLVRLTR